MVSWAGENLEKSTWNSVSAFGIENKGIFKLQ
jgi:hypothetical protein